jgi:FkbM family methyltransferase
MAGAIANIAITAIGRAFGVKIVRSGNLLPLIEQEHLQRFFRHFQVDCIFDVGANAGQYADMVRTSCGFSGPIISFEPIPTMAARLERRAARTNNWHIEQTVLGSCVEPVNFHVMEGDQFSSMNRPKSDGAISSEPIVETLSMQSTTLKDHFDRYQRLLGFKRPFLKMDTQGSDLEVARGAADRLKQFVGIQSEISFEPLYENIPTAAESLDFYRSQGFTLSAFVPNNSGQFPRLFESDCILYRSDALG